jgi:hypothetical protein
VKLIWHYTNGQNIDAILKDGVIQLATAGIVCERLARVQHLDVLTELLAFEEVGKGDDFFYCCDSHRPTHRPGCLLDRLLSQIGLPDAKSRDDLRAASPLEG